MGDSRPLFCRWLSRRQLVRGGGGSHRRPGQLSRAFVGQTVLKEGELMVTRTATSVKLLVLSLGPLCGQDKEVAPGNPPVVLIASEIDKDGSLALVQYRTIFIQPTKE